MGETSSIVCAIYVPIIKNQNDVTLHRSNLDVKKVYGVSLCTCLISAVEGWTASVCWPEVSSKEYK